MTTSLTRPNQPGHALHGDTSLDSVAELLGDLLRAQHLLKRYLGDLLRPHGLSYPRYQILSLLAHTDSGRLEKVVIDRALERHHTTTRSLVEGLECSGYVRSYRNPADRRGTIIAITDHGTSKVQLAGQILTEAVTDTELAGFATHLAHDLTANLRVLLDGILDHKPSSGSDSKDQLRE